MVYKVFVSSTRIDLPRHREAVRDALLKTGYFPVEMEDFGARDAEPVTACLGLVGESDLFVGVYAWRYGFMPPGAERSITAEELEQARRLGKPRFCFLVDESQPWPAVPGIAEESPESRELLRAFKSSLRAERMVASFSTPDELALEVVTALRRWEMAKAPAADPERRQQLDLVDQVERYWIKGVLQRTVAESGPLLRDREERAGDVAKPWETPVWTEPGEPALLPSRPPLDLFVERGRRLLILGEGGYGKTTELLLLVAGLLQLARDDAQQPVPVVLKLASWGRRSRRLADWMISQIAERHKLDAALVRRWIDGDRVLPLLDGLDEVEPGCRDACARAINEYLGGHPDRSLAVTCRNDVVDELSQRLDVRDAYALRPLSDAALDRHLAAAGPDAEPLRAALTEPGWRELAHTPLLLVMMERVLRAPARRPSWRARQPRRAPWPLPARVPPRPVPIRRPPAAPGGGCSPPTSTRCSSSRRGRCASRLRAPGAASPGWPPRCAPTAWRSSSSTTCSRAGSAGRHASGSTPSPHGRRAACS